MPALLITHVTVLAVLITPVQSPFPWTLTVASSVACLVLIIAAVFLTEFRRNRH
jgi:hypothetical protein